MQEWRVPFQLPWNQWHLKVLSFAWMVSFIFNTLGVDVVYVVISWCHDVIPCCPFSSTWVSDRTIKCDLIRFWVDVISTQKFPFDGILYYICGPMTICSYFRRSKISISHSAQSIMFFMGCFHQAVYITVFTIIRLLVMKNCVRSQREGKKHNTLA